MDPGGHLLRVAQSVSGVHGCAATSRSQCETTIKVKMLIKPENFISDDDK
jgi:hypothetical protein